MITKDAAIQAIKSLCLDNGEIAQRIWSSDAIDAVRKIPESGGWISCEDRLPKKVGEYIVCNRGKAMTAVYCDGWVSPYRHHHITHWMPMPEGPKGDA